MGVRHRRRGRLVLVSAAVLALIIAACGAEEVPADGEPEAAEGAATEEAAPPEEDDQEAADLGDFPDGPIELVVPFSAGGSIDGLARNIAPHWEEELGATVTVNNVEGSGGQLGFADIWNDDGDGHRVLVAVEPFLTTAILRGAEYELSDWAMINIQQFDPITITVREDSPFETLADLVNHAQENPGEVSYSTVPGGAIQILPRAFAEELDLDMREVTFDGGAETRAAMLSGEVDFATSTATGDIPLEGEARILGMATDSPPAHLEGVVPLINEELSEFGVTLPEIGSSRFLAVPRRVADEYPERFAHLVETYEAAFNDPGHQERAGAAFDSMTYYGPEESDRLAQALFETSLRFEDILLGG